MLALAHHWLVKMRGGEKVLKAFCDLYPDASISTLVANIGDSSEFRDKEIHTSLLQQIPNSANAYRRLLPLHPAAISRLGVPKGSKIVLVSDASMMKGLRVPSDAIVICYCHSPPRYIWEMVEEYSQFGKLSFMSRLLFRCTVPYCKSFDYRAAQRVDYFIANSNFVRERIQRYYKRSSTVIHPPVEFDALECTKQRDGYYLVVSELVPYKRIDLAIEAFNQLGRKLVVVGEGTEERRLQSMANNNIEFMGRQPFDVLKQKYEKCRAFVFPGLEDFGITPLEAQAAGAPVIAFGRGGALETVVDRVTGIFFAKQTVESLKIAVLDFEQQRHKFEPSACRQNADSFKTSNFLKSIESFVGDCANQKGVRLIE